MTTPVCCQQEGVFLDKEAGNEHFRTSRFADASEAYSKALAQMAMLTTPSDKAAAAAFVEEKAAILDSIVKLIQSAALNPGGDNFGNATKNLNQFFAGTPASEYALPPAARARLPSPAASLVRRSLSEARRYRATRHHPKISRYGWGETTAAV